MKLCRFLDSQTGVRLGAVLDGAVQDLTALGEPRLASLDALLSAGLHGAASSLAEELAASIHRAPIVGLWPELASGSMAGGLRLLAPLEGQEVWGAGVTYTRSREAREQESGGSSLYDRVYSAQRPELFFKATAARVAGPGEAVCVRGDSRWTVPEPELALVLDAHLELVGFTLGNDVTARDLEGENALYLPQAKIFTGCCALGPAITLAGDLQSLETLEIRCVIRRGDRVILEESYAVGRMKRPLAELVQYLGRDNAFPHGVILLTGTGMVPPDDLALADGDVVTVWADGLGALVNPVRQLPVPGRIGATGGQGPMPSRTGQSEIGAMGDEKKCPRP